MNTDLITLAAGVRVDRVYWAATHHYGFVEHESQEAAEAYAREHPTSIETLSYAERGAGIRPAGVGYVELRVVTSGGSDVPLIRYPVEVPRGG